MASSTQISDEIALGLRAIGIAPGTRAVLMVPPGLDLFALVFAVFKAGIVPVLIDPGIGLRNLGQCCREAAPEVFIGIPRAILAGRLLGWGRETVRRRIVVAARDGLPSRCDPARCRPPDGTGDAGAGGPRDAASRACRDR